MEPDSKTLVSVMNRHLDRMALLLFLSALLMHCASAGASLRNPPPKELPRPGEVFFVDGHTAFIIPVKVNSARTSKPWVWYALTLPGLPGKEEEWRFDQFLDAGIAIFQNQELVNFVKAQAGPTITMLSPLDHQVIQRSSKNKGTLIITGELAGFTAKTLTIEARLIVNGRPGKWRQLSVNQERRSFEALWDAPAGGRHRLELRALSGAKFWLNR